MNQMLVRPWILDVHWNRLVIRINREFHVLTGCSVSPKQGKVWTSNEVRQTFVDYFQQNDHRFVPSSPVIPRHDPSLLFVNAGMNQFKPIFLNADHDVADSTEDDPLTGLTKVVNWQKCIRLSGKHNDFEEVGKNFRHHTFFEMLGNWAFKNAYFKKEACSMAWDVLVNVFAMDPNRLLVTYFAGDQRFGLEADNETKRIWLDLGVPAERLIALGAVDNFWEMGDEGPCGGCTEIHYILNESDAKRFNDEMKNLKSDGSEQRRKAVQLDVLTKSLEIWNLVFMQYHRTSDGNLQNLTAVHVDTGMGLERMLSVLNGSQSNYDTDLFNPMFKIIHQETHYEDNEPYGGTLTRTKDAAYRVIADHIRAVVIAVSDDCVPSKVDAGFCLRKLIRRVHVLLRETFHQKSSAHLVRILIDQVIESLSQAYPDLAHKRDRIQIVVEQEILLFQSKMKAARKFVKKMCNDPTTWSNDDVSDRCLSGIDTLRLQKRFGLPKESIQHLANDYRFRVRWDEFDRLIREDHEKTLIGQQLSNKN